MPTDTETQFAAAQARRRERVKERTSHRVRAQRRRDAQVDALHPHLRTFELVEAHAVSRADADPSALPRTLTMVTPDLKAPAKAHLFVGSHPVREHSYDDDFRDLDFRTGDGANAVVAHLRLTHSRTRAHGTLDYGGESFAVEYAVKPQRYRMKLGKGAAYVAGSSTMPTIRWDVDSARWKDAHWDQDYTVDFTFGVNGEEIIGGEIVYTFISSFSSSSRRWDPRPEEYGGYVNTKGQLKFALQAGAVPPKSGPGDTSVFPYLMQVTLTEFAEDFVGGMLCDHPDASGTCFGLKGVWAQAQAGGLYHVRDDAEDGSQLVVGVHDGVLHVGDTPVPSSKLDGDTLTWDGLPDGVTALPASGHLVFSQDGDHILDSSLGATGSRVHPDSVAEVAHALRGAGDHAAILTGTAPEAEPPEHTLSALLSMTQYARNADGQYYDRFQQESMEDFYAILQNNMNADYRRQFFDPNPPPLDPGVYGISKVRGTKGTDPAKWYRDLSTAYTCGALSKWSPDPAAKTLNGIRADAWVQNQTTVSDVMAAQAPLLYARRYGNTNKNLAWFLADQRDNAAKYNPIIDGQVTAWIAEMRAQTTGTPEELQKLIDQITEVGAKAKQNKQYWAFAVYTYTTKPSYLNLLQTIISGGDEIDGSEFTQRVQRTVALLNVLDTTSFFTSQYAYLLQLFQLATVLPQFMDYSQDIKDFSFAVKQIVDKFVQQYLKSPDPKMREAAEQLAKYGSQELCDQVLMLLKQAAAARGGLYSWTRLAADFETKIARVFAKIPSAVPNLIAFGAASLLMNFFITGQIKWGDLTPGEKASIVTASAGIVAQLGLMIVQRGIAFGEVFASGAGLWRNLRLFFSPSLITKAQGVTASTFKSWLLNGTGLADELESLAMRALFAETAAEAAALYSQAGRLNTINKIFGRNLQEFMATRIGAALAAVGIVMAAIELAKGGTPMEIAANTLFLLSSTLEFIATAGAWACAAFEIATIGGMAVGTIFAVVSVLGVVALVAGVVLICVMMFMPKPSPVEKFAKDDAGRYYMPAKTAIDYFQEYQAKGQPQRSGVCVLADGDRKRALYVASDGALRQAPFDASGHTALYLRVDQDGRAQLGAPVVDEEGRNTFYVLSLDKDGKLVAKVATEDTTTDLAQLWHAEIDGEGDYEDGHLRSANFRLYNASWSAQGKGKRYVSATGSGWSATDGHGTRLRVEMVTTAPGTLRMGDIVWHTYEHDQKSGPSLVVPGSAPRTFSITPALPQGLVFNEKNGQVSMATGVDQRPFPETKYTLTVHNAAGSSTCEFKLRIEAAAVVTEVLDDLVVPRRSSDSAVPTA